MAEAHTLECQRQFAMAADKLWQVVGDFYADWHPFIEQCVQEAGKPVRRFTMPGSEQVYREQLIYFSTSQRCFQYEMLEGIAGIERYRAGVSVEANASGCLLHWWADIEGDDDLVAKVAQGTREVFEAGFDKLGKRAKRGFSVEEINTPQKLTCNHHLSPNNPDHLCLFLHGIGGNRSNWNDQLPAIAQIMPCAAIDLRGYGDSDLGESQTTIEDYCADIRAVVDHFGAKYLVLAGLSYGSWIATHFALHYPDELAGLVLCGGCTGMSEAPEAVRQGFLQARLEPLDAGQALADFADSVVEIISGPKASTEQKGALRQSMAAIPVATYRDALHCFTHPPGQFDFAQLACPVLLMTGEYDRLAPPEEIASVAQRMVGAERSATSPLPDVQFEVLSGAGHIANLEQPAAYNQLLATFLTKLVGHQSSSDWAQEHQEA